jgi:uncharacterized protein
MNTSILLLGAGFVAGAMNAMAGGGSFVTLPALTGAGLSSVSANASSTVALWPGGALSAFVYRGGLTQVCGVPLRPSLAATLAGGFVGAMLLLWTPTSVFDRVLPWLLLLATAALAFGPWLGPALRARFRAGVGTVLGVQFVLGVYGGYFGGAVGLMMGALWNLLDDVTIKALNAPRTLMVTAANSVAALIFVVAGAVRWPATLLVGCGALAGGYAGARLGRALPAWVVRTATVSLALAMTIKFFVRGYG